jgi:hypothetical protein
VNPHPIPAEQRRQLAVTAHAARRHSHDGPTWDVPGIEAAIERCGGTPCDIIAALFTLAGDPNARTPGLLPRPGKHWPVRDGHTTAPATPNRTPCHEHPGQSWPCPECEATWQPATPAVRAQAIADARAAIAAARSKPRPTVRPEVGPGSVA